MVLLNPSDRVDDTALDVDAGTLGGASFRAARVRLLMPRGLIEHQGPDLLIGELRKFAENWRTEEVDELEVEPLAQNRLKTGRMVFVSHRFRLRSVTGESTAKMVIKHLLAIADGRIALVDELCSGVMPEPQ